MKLNCGFVGLPNVGKSTLFNALSKNNIAAENATSKPEIVKKDTSINIMIISHLPIKNIKTI